MNDISFIGAGFMSRVIAARAVAGGNAVEIIARDEAKATAVAEALGGGATTAKFGAVPGGDIVVLGLPAADIEQVVREYGDSLAGKILVDITNPFNSTATGLARPDGTSIAELVAGAAPASAHVIKAFNTVFGACLAKGGKVDVFFAGDDAQAMASFGTFVASLGLRPLDVGGLSMAQWMEATALLMMGLAGHGVGNFDFVLGVTAV